MKTLYQISLIIIAFFASKAAFAQTSPKANISGIILDESKKPADYVTVVLFKASDSSVVKTAFTDPKGIFNFDVKSKGSLL